MKLFTYLIGVSALFIAGCAAYFSVRGIALTFGAVSAFTIPIIIMASSLEFGKLMAASFLYRHWNVCNKVLRTYLMVAVGVLICITSAGIYGYLSQAFEETVSQVAGYERKIASLRAQQQQYDREIVSYQNVADRNITFRRKKNTDERQRLNSYIAERQREIQTALKEKSQLSGETDRTIQEERKQRDAEQLRQKAFRETELARLQSVITQRREDIDVLNKQKTSLRTESDNIAAVEQARIEQLNERISTLDAAVKTYRDKGPGGLFREDGLKKASELLKEQAPEREAIRAQISRADANIQKARDDLSLRHTALDKSNDALQEEIAEANRQINTLPNKGNERADNVRVALENLQTAREAVDKRIDALEEEIRNTSQKITQIAEVGDIFDPKETANLDAKKADLLVKKEEAEQAILKLDDDIRATDIGSFKFVARSFHPSVEKAEATGNAELIRATTDEAVRLVVRWFIMIIVIVFDPLAVTLIVAFNASLLKGEAVLVAAKEVATNEDDDIESDEETPKEERVPTAPEWKKSAYLPLYIFAGVILLWGIFSFFGGSGDSSRPALEGVTSVPAESSSSRKTDYLALNLVPQEAFAVCAFSGARVMSEVGLPKVVLDEFVRNAPFVRNVCWDPKACGVDGDGVYLYFLKFPENSRREGHESDILFTLLFPLEDSARFKEWILSQFNLKTATPEWRVVENESPKYVAVGHRSGHISVGFNNECLAIVTSWWSTQPDPEFLDGELRELFSSVAQKTSNDNNPFARLARRDFDLALMFDAARFFSNLDKEDTQNLYLDVRPFLDFKCLLSGRMTNGEVLVDGQYTYDSPVLDEDFGISVASKLENIRATGEAGALRVAQGEFMEIFLQRLDYHTVCKTLEQIDLAKSVGFEGFLSKNFVRQNVDKSSGSFSLELRTVDPGGIALCNTIDLLVAALNPLGPDTSSSKSIRPGKSGN